MSRWGLGAVAAAAVVRVGLFSSTATAGLTQPDSATYLAMAERFPAAYLATHPWSIMRPPGYPVFLFLVGGGIRGAVLLQIGVSVATVALVYQFGRMMLSDPAGSVAAWLVALEPATIFHSTLVLAETLFVFWLVAGTLVLWKAVERGSWRLGGSAGLLFALAALTRPLGAYLPPLLGVGLLVLRHRRVAAALLAAALLPVVGWTARNYVQAGVPSISSIDSQSILYYRAAGAIAASEGRDFLAVRDELEARMDARSFATAGDRYRAERALGLELLARHPAGLIAATAPKAVMMLFGTDYAPFRRNPGLAGLFFPLSIPLVDAILLTGVYAAAAVGAWWLLRTDRVALLLLIALTAYLAVVPLGPETYDRFRVPWWPFVALLAAAGLRRRDAVSPS